MESTRLTVCSPVGLKEAALDSISFRAACVHFGEQADAAEKWLDTYVKAIVKLSGEVGTLESLVTGFLSATAPPVNLSEAIIDHGYTFLAASKYGEGAQSFWGSTITAMKKLDSTMVDPIRSFLQNEVRPFKETKKQLLEAQKHYDHLLSRYYAQKKTTEVSSLREDAFQLHEARKTYLKASMDFAVAAPHLRLALDRMLVRVFSDQSQQLRSSRHRPSSKWGKEVERIRSWSREMESGERAFRKELATVRKQMEEDAETAARPSRELEEYNPVVTRGPSGTFQPTKIGPPQAEKQGWLGFRTATGKPVRTLWVERWGYVKHGIFGWLIQDPKSGAVLESERIGILLIGVRPAVQEERRFCFEVKTKDRTIILQAKSPVDLADWMATFNVAKQKALEEPSSTEPAAPNSQGFDPAFAITLPQIPEFAAGSVDLSAHSSEDSSDRVQTLGAPGTDGLAYRGSFDVPTSRRSTALEDGGRESRLLSKLKSGGQSPAFNGPVGTAGGGIASLIQATHGSIGALPPSPMPDIAIRGLSPGPRAMKFTAMSSLPPSTLAPSTLVTLPNSTNLSITAVMVNGEHDADIVPHDSSGAIPSGMLANTWGSSAWGFTSRLQGHEIKAPEPKVETTKDYSPDRASAMSSTQVTPSLSREASDQSGRFPSLGHGKAVNSEDGTTGSSRAMTKRKTYPSNYPLQLKHQDAQFGLLFPMATVEETLLMAFEASWSATEQQEFPGRVYVTEKAIYFYSNHVGFVLVTGFALENLLEITTAPGRESDFIFLHLKHENVNYTRITIKTFLEPMRLLETRLILLLQNSRAELPDTLENLIDALINLEGDKEDSSQIDESYSEGRSLSRTRNRDLHGANRDVQARIQVGEVTAHEQAGSGRDDVKFKLPSKPVVYIPRGMSHATMSKTFEMSPKALFHVLFGDRSAVWQILYHERQAKSIRQGPWTASEGSDHLRRTFVCSINSSTATDTQLVDVNNDHLCYVVTDRKTPWYLPYSSSYTLITKVVITYIGKSRCKLAIFTAIEWNSRQPLAIVKALVESAALQEIELDTKDLIDVTTDQVRKLGAHSHTKKAVQIFGHVGQQTQTLEFGDGSAAGLDLHIRPLRKRNLFQLMFEAIGRWLRDFFSSIGDMIRVSIRGVGSLFQANYVIVLVLIASVLANLFLSSMESFSWWQTRSANTYMRELGIGPDLMMNKAVSISDLELATQLDLGIDVDTESECLRTFTGMALDMSSPYDSSAVATRLRRTRERTGIYRHDLLVAMRVVNKIETEIVQAEWESWVKAETKKCDRAEGILKKCNESEVEALGYKTGRLGEFCSSCRQTLASIARRGK